MAGRVGLVEDHQEDPAKKIECYRGVLPQLFSNKFERSNKKIIKTNANINLIDCWKCFLCAFNYVLASGAYRVGQRSADCPGACCLGEPGAGQFLGEGQLETDDLDEIE